MIHLLSWEEYDVYGFLLLTLEHTCVFSTSANIVYICSFSSDPISRVTVYHAFYTC